MPRLSIFLFAFIFCFSLFIGKSSAQCEHAGQVLGSDCGKVLYDYSSGSMLVPVGDELESVEIETDVMFSFEVSGEPSNCAQLPGASVDLTCFEIVNLPSTDCNPDFYYTENFGYAPSVSFEPADVNSDHSYHWDFGDGEWSDEMLPVHEYETQGTYEVCLTLSSAACTELTTCQTIDLHECHASFAYEAVGDGVVNFTDFSDGNFTEWEWKMGDGAVFTNEVVESHIYNGVDIYTVCLTVWNATGCTHEYCDYIFTGTGDVCDFSDCVLPGDTDADQLANVYDLLPIGVAYGSEGPPRSLDEVSTGFITWEPQYSPDWGLQTVSGVDYKHIDCNGDGMIDELDMDAIETNYSAPENVFMASAPGEPYFWLEFDFDTVVVTDDSAPFLHIEADLMVGLPDLPVENLYGFALQMDYPEELLLEGGVAIDYNDNSFFGDQNSVITMHRDRFDESVMDIAFTRKSLSVNGFGKVADMSFIVIADAVPRSSLSTPFTVNLNGVAAVNQDGAQLTLDQPDEPATLIIVNKTTTATKDNWLNQQVSVSPNPASGEVWVNIDGLDGELLEVFNTLGQRMASQKITSPQVRLDVSGFAGGIYLLHVHTAEGMAMKRLIVE